MGRLAYCVTKNLIIYGGHLLLLG